MLTNKKNILFCFFTIVFFIFLILSIKNIYAIAVMVNDEPIYEYEIKEIMSYLKSKNLKVERDDIIKNGIAELLVLQQSNSYHVDVAQKELDERIKDLRENHSDLYNIMLQRYKTDEEYKKALKNKITFDKVKGKVIEQLKLNNNYIEYLKGSPNIDATFCEEVLKYNEKDIPEAMIEQIENCYFNEFINELYINSNIKYCN